MYDATPTQLGIRLHEDKEYYYYIIYYTTLHYNIITILLHYVIREIT